VGASGVVPEVVGGKLRRANEREVQPHAPSPTQARERE
jgi:hypothetical protein